MNWLWWAPLGAAALQIGEDGFAAWDREYRSEFRKSLPHLVHFLIGYEGWSVEEALAEAKEHGLDWWQGGMRTYIRESCGNALAGALR